MRPEVASVGDESFYEFAKMFYEHDKDLTAGGRPVLLTYDAYRSHLSVRALLHFRKNNVIIYSLPAKTSGKTQSVDVTLYGSFKREITNNVSDAVDIPNAPPVDVHSFCLILRYAFNKVFNRHEIQSLFLIPRIWPVDRKQVVSTLKPCDADDLRNFRAVDLSYCPRVIRDTVHSSK